MNKEKFPEGHFIAKWTGIGVAIGAGIGIPFGLVVGNPAFFGVGLPIGVAIGAAIGSSVEKRAIDEGRIRPLNAKEKKEKAFAVYAGLATVILGLVVLLAFILMR